MKAYIRYFRLLAVIFLSLELAACGGYTTVDLGGSVTGLTTDGLVLANGNSTIAIPANATSYTFPDQIDDQGQYAITVQSQPSHLTCVVAHATGSATGVAIDAANVSCTLNTHTVGGTINGLSVDGLALANGSDTVGPLTAGSAGFTFPAKVSEGAVYGVAVLSQPPGLTCSVLNGTAVMGAADVADIQVNCQ